jgi:deferrochelatase/peroxidase EfeB
MSKRSDLSAAAKWLSQTIALENDRFATSHERRPATPKAGATRVAALSVRYKSDDSMLRMILRRGIAYGEPYLGVAHPDPDADRGLMFLCYGATIEDQFEFLTRRWSTCRTSPTTAGTTP